MKTLIFLATVLTVLCAQADGNVYESELSAAISALRAHNDISLTDNREYGGEILFDGAEYRYTVRRSAPGRQVSMSVVAPSGYEIVALWHTHGRDNAMGSYFSRGDVEIVKRVGLPLYLGDYTKILKVLRPQHKSMERFGFLLGKNPAKGEKILIKMETVRL